MKLLELFSVISEATLSVPVLNKYGDRRWDILLDRIVNGDDFKLKNNAGGTFKIEPQEDLLQAIRSRNFAGTPYAKGSSILLPTVGGGEVKLNDIYKDKKFGGKEAGKEQSERQETGLINTINSAVESAGGSITLITKNENMPGVTKAEKISGTNRHGKEHYADIAITANGKKLAVSAKGTTSPSIAGGGLAGILGVDKGIVKHALETAKSFYEKNYSHLEGKHIPDGGIPELYVRIPHKFLLDILRGTPEMGGPIDYMYIGPMTVTSELTDNILRVDGSLTPIEEFANTVEDLFLRIRRRGTNQTLDLSNTDRSGYPSLFYAAGEGHRRVVVVKKADIPKNAKPISEDVYVSNEK